MSCGAGSTKVSGNHTACSENRRHSVQTRHKKHCPRKGTCFSRSFDSFHPRARALNWQHQGDLCGTWLSLLYYAVFTRSTYSGLAYNLFTIVKHDFLLMNVCWSFMMSWIENQVAHLLRSLSPNPCPFLTDYLAT